MDVAVVRDLVIGITGSVFLILLIVVIILAILTYRRIKALTKTISTTIDDAKEMGSHLGEAVWSLKDLIGILKTSGSKDGSKEEKVGTEPKKKT
jgi:hypothetical protein